MRDTDTDEDLIVALNVFDRDGNVFQKLKHKAYTSVYNRAVKHFSGTAVCAASRQIRAEVD